MIPSDRGPPALAGASIRPATRAPRRIVLLAVPEGLRSARGASGLPSGMVTGFCRSRLSPLELSPLRPSVEAPWAPASRFAERPIPENSRETRRGRPPPLDDGCPGRICTGDLQVMGLASYCCSTGHMAPKRRGSEDPRIRPQASILGERGLPCLGRGMLREQGPPVIQS